MTERPPYQHALGAAAALFALYLATLAPTTWFWDTSEYIATAHILGLPHPPGNPLFVVLGKVWSLLLQPTGLSVAVRINLFAALTSSVATGFFFLVTHRVLAGWISRGESVERQAEVPLLRRIPLIGAWAGAILGGTAFTVWNQSNVNEKVYTLSVLVIALVSWLAVRWVDRKDEPGSGWYLILAVYLMTLGTANHLMSMLPAPALLLLVLVEKPSIFGSWRFLLRTAAALFLALSFNFFLPIRSELQPAINEGEPICESLAEAAVAVYSQGRGGCPALADNLTRRQYDKPSIFTDPTARVYGREESRGIGLIGYQFLTYFQYFDWQWARGISVSSLPAIPRLPFTLVFLGLGLWGIAVAARSRRGHIVYLGVLALTLTGGLVYYLNFKYGFSLYPEGTPQELREVRERDYFFIASFHLWGFLAGMGLVAGWRWAAGGKDSDRRSFGIAAPILLLALVPLVFNWGWASRRGDYSARDWAYDVLQSVEPYAILFTNGDNDTFPLWYLQEVEGIRQDVTVIVGQYLHTYWYPRQLRYHSEPGRQRLFTPDEAVAGLYGEVPAPTSPITDIPDEALDRVSPRPIALDEVLNLNLGAAVLQYPVGFQLGRDDQIALAIIRDSMDERPIYFASTGGMARDLGLEQWVVRQGLASKLWPENPAESQGVVRVAEGMTGGEWLDFERSFQLAREVFSYRGLSDRAIWADRATLNIPWHFYLLHAELAEGALRERDDRLLADELITEANRFYLTAAGGARAAEGLEESAEEARPASDPEGETANPQDTGNTNR